MWQSLREKMHLFLQDCFVFARKDIVLKAFILVRDSNLQLFMNGFYASLIYTMTTNCVVPGLFNNDGFGDISIIHYIGSITEIPVRWPWFSISSEPITEVKGDLFPVWIIALSLESSYLGFPTLSRSCKFF